MKRLQSNSKHTTGRSLNTSRNKSVGIVWKPALHQSLPGCLQWCRVETMTRINGETWDKKNGTWAQNHSIYKNNNLIQIWANELHDTKALNIPQPTQKERFKPNAHTSIFNLGLYLFLNKTSKHSCARCGPNFSLFLGATKLHIHQLSGHRMAENTPGLPHAWLAARETVRGMGGVEVWLGEALRATISF